MRKGIAEHATKKVKEGEMQGSQRGMHMGKRGSASAKKANEGDGGKKTRENGSHHGEWKKGDLK